ncbi:type II CRISPR-associated endonuclease Cas1 [Rhodopila globiformis]|uniref:CRISPR-associated endonuclease Cas1 n=1 Tax=Rhodopila globiformis TaxID=1071 RepID=A0A2S6NPG7_RHOGL|nr:type II CRISPR-associated endonuclease Cas1 [Rhodopila globiformis]PPQ40868.1 subtype II CRISPR-associated endonuclease Cas1 [Rhodopila globiformis]
MAWRGLHVSRPTRLSLADNQIVARQDETEARIAIEDIGWIVLDSPQVTLSTALIAACMEAGVAVITTDRTHTPSGLLLPFHRHHRQAEMAALQAGLPLPLKKRLWQALVRTKIDNQAACLATCGQDATALRAMAHLVGSGDPDNVEARAARAYWPRLFSEFVREDDTDKRNALLNYGYAVVRSAVARALVAAGLVPALGLNHASMTNAFNLADDMVEPFRPFVDRQVWQLSAKGTVRNGQTTVEERRTLASILTETTVFGTDTVSLLTATEQAAESLVRAMQTSSAAVLQMPRMVA